MTSKFWIHARDTSKNRRKGRRFAISAAPMNQSRIHVVVEERPHTYLVYLFTWLPSLHALKLASCKWWSETKYLIRLQEWAERFFETPGLTPKLLAYKQWYTINTIKCLLLAVRLFHGVVLEYIAAWSRSSSLTNNQQRVILFVFVGLYWFGFVSYIAAVVGRSRLNDYCSCSCSTTV